MKDSESDNPENQSLGREQGSSETGNYFENSKVKYLSVGEFSCADKAKAIKKEKHRDDQLNVVLEEKYQCKYSSGQKGKEQTGI